MKIDSLGKEKFTAGQGEIFPWAGKIKVVHDSRKEALLINVLSFTKM